MYERNRIEVAVKTLQQYGRVQSGQLNDRVAVENPSMQSHDCWTGRLVVHRKRSNQPLKEGEVGDGEHCHQTKE